MKIAKIENLSQKELSSIRDNIDYSIGVSKKLQKTINKYNDKQTIIDKIEKREHTLYCRI